MIFQFLMVAGMKNGVMWGAPPETVVDVYQCSIGACWR